LIDVGTRGRSELPYVKCRIGANIAVVHIGNSIWQRSNFRHMRLCVRIALMFLVLAVTIRAWPAAGQTQQAASQQNELPDEPEADPGRPTVSNPATLAPVGYLQFETGTLGATGSLEFST
jgi:hypothetical protein